jgi:hypothetical protein
MTLIAIAQDEMVERILGPRPSRLGTRRRGPRAVRTATPLGGSRSGRKPGAPSLDTEKLLETSVQELSRKGASKYPVTCRVWAAGERTEEDVRKEKWSLKKQLTSTVHQIWQEKAHEAKDGTLELWFAALDAVKKPRASESDTERTLRVAVWVKANKLTGKDAEALKWFRQYEQLRNCQAQWVFRLLPEESSTRHLPVIALVSPRRCREKYRLISAPSITVQCERTDGPTH